ncbi:hypothetical protein GIB67_005824 [Kingdonia uniflora]|uniref:Uncharacterized protein n=1 Tax=Kingdonia uniflora TaxID=39325 RepID=A0A7J7LU28_9MAGN|nr:hypothetical protein GIB67_005824 [Kingdonia uniflora]
MFFELIQAILGACPISDSESILDLITNSIDLTHTRGEPNFRFRHNAQPIHPIIPEASPTSDSDSMFILIFSATSNQIIKALEVEVLEAIKTYYRARY